MKVNNASSTKGMTERKVAVEEKMFPCQECQKGMARSYVGCRNWAMQLDQISRSWDGDVVEQLESQSLVKSLKATSAFAIEARVSIQRLSEGTFHNS